VRFLTRLFAATSLLVVATVVGLLLAAHLLLRPALEDEVARGLEGEARLVALLVPADSLRWPEAVRDLGGRLGRRVTLIDPRGRVRGDTELDRAAPAALENQLARPEVQQALLGAVGRAVAPAASSHERQLFVAVRGGPPGIAVTRVSTALGAVDGQVAAVQRALVVAGVLVLLAAAALLWRLARDVATPLGDLAAAARAIADGRPPVFPVSRFPELAQHVVALRAMHEQLERRFTDLRRERAESAALIETMADGVVAADARGAVVTLNRAARRLLGYGPEDAVPALGELFHEKAARQLVQAVLAGEEIEPRELERGGRALLLGGRALPNGGALLVIRDVTELRRLEAVRRDFVANVSHELKTPLTSLAGYAETLAAEAGADTQTGGFARTILSNARRMQRLVDELLDLSRIESGRWQPAPERVDVAVLAREAWAPFADRARERRVEFAIDVAAPGRLTADPDALRQVFTNLLDNALRHTAAGGRITIAAEAAPGGVALAVTDTGSGIEPDHLPRIFERFYRADPGRSRDEGGTGLGLAIVKHLVEAHGGRVDARSVVGRGTTIRIFLPQDDLDG
jgi:two-component system, OmpR family, phosphate regulon sensor histidine kinase PhoR